MKDWRKIKDLYPEERHYKKPFVDSSISLSRIDFVMIHDEICRICKKSIPAGKRAIYLERTNTYEHLHCNQHKRTR